MIKGPTTAVICVCASVAAGAAQAQVSKVVSGVCAAEAPVDWRGQKGSVDNTARSERLRLRFSGNTANTIINGALAGAKVIRSGDITILQSEVESSSTLLPFFKTRSWRYFAVLAAGRGACVADIMTSEEDIGLRIAKSLRIEAQAPATPDPSLKVARTDDGGPATPPHVSKPKATAKAKDPSGPGPSKRKDEDTNVAPQR